MRKVMGMQVNWGVSWYLLWQTAHSVAVFRYLQLVGVSGPQV